MSFSGYGSRFERRRRDRWRMAMLRLTIYGAVIGAISYWAYTMGGEYTQRRNRALKEQMSVLAEENERLRVEADAAVGARIAAEERAASFQRRYRTEVPQGAVREIMDAMRARIEEGITPARIAHVVGAVQNETGCRDEVANRRFIVQTPISNGSNSSVSFADNLVTVTGAGISARDSAGNAEAWFDPVQPVTIAFTLPGGEQTVAEGVLPLHHSVVLDDEDHRYTVTASQARGFVTVTEQMCDYP
jgi:hypothetical protein